MSDASSTGNEAKGRNIISWNERIIAEFRTNGGYVAWSSDHEFAAGRPIPPRVAGFDEQGLPLILLHHIDAKTGRERISPMFFQPVGDSWAVFGTHGGSLVSQYHGESARHSGSGCGTSAGRRSAHEGR
jgi:hypothetical protein